MAGCFCFAVRGIISPRLRTIIGNEQGRAASFRRGESVVSAIFGTDGIRGRVPGELNASLAFRLGFSVGSMLWEEGETRPRVAVGQDPRSSSDMLEAAVVAGVCASGADAERLSVIPTPAGVVVHPQSRPAGGHHDLRLPQPVCVQRHQVLHARGTQAERAAGTASAGAARTDARGAGGHPSGGTGDSAHGRSGAGVHGLICPAVCRPISAGSACCSTVQTAPPPRPSPV